MEMQSAGSSALAERQAFYRRIGSSHLAPLWEVLGALVPRAPTSPIAPAHWRYADIRDYVMEAGTLITAKEAERRVLVLENQHAPLRFLRRDEPAGFHHVVADIGIAPVRRHDR